MATSGMEVDSRAICSVCLEPFKGRQPKILPCFHTFCLPCLTRLVERETSGAGSTDDEGRPCANLTCPTCRRVTPVPPGGVVEFQAKFYVEDSSKLGSTQPPPCNLCDGVHDASYQCHKCQRNLCTECRRYHDKLCMGSQVTELQQASSFSSSSMGVEGASHSTVKQQLQKVEDVMKKLTKEEKEVNQERRLVESDINDRYATLLRHAGEARDVCLTSLRETCQGVTDRLQSHMTRAKQTQDTLTQQLSCPQPAPISVPQLITALFLDGDLQTVLTTDSDRKRSVLHHEMKDNTEMLVNCMQSFMGRVVESGQAATGVHSKSSSPELGILGDRGSSLSGEASLVSAGAGDLQSIQQRLDDLTRQVTMLQTANVQLLQNVTVLSDKSSSKISSVEKELAAVRDKTASDQMTVQRELTALQEKNTKLTADQAVVQREVKTLRDKNAIALQDLSVMSSEKDQLRAEVAKLQQDVISMQTDSSMLQTDVIQLKMDCDSVMTDIKTALNDITALQGDVNTAKNDFKKVEADQTTVKSVMTTVQSDVKTLQGDTTTAKNDLTTLKTDHSSLRSDISSAQKHITALQGDNSTLKSDVKSSKSQLTSLQQSVQSAQDSLRDRTSKITALETRLNKAGTQVAFHARLSEEVTTTTEQTLICDDVFTNVGSGYSGQTGVFTAPVAGTYCFMVTTSPNEPDSEKKARLDIMLENVMKGYTFSLGYSWSTGHTVIKVSAGQKVWLRTYSDQEYIFGGGGWTKFSGMLLQPDF